MVVTKETAPITWQTMPEPDYYPCHLCVKEKAVIHLGLTVNEILFKLRFAKRAASFQEPKFTVKSKQ